MSCVGCDMSCISRLCHVVFVLFFYEFGWIGQFYWDTILYNLRLKWTLSKLRIPVSETLMKNKSIEIKYHPRAGTHIWEPVFGIPKMYQPSNRFKIFWDHLLNLLLHVVAQWDKYTCNTITIYMLTDPIFDLKAGEGIVLSQSMRG